MLRSKLLALATTSAFAAAQTFIVDIANGHGADFTDLPTAVATVPDGSVLLVRPGGYGPVQLAGKGLSILATAPGVVIDSLFTAPVRVAHLTAGQTFTLRGVALGESGLSRERVYLQACAGAVLLQAVVFQSSQPNPGTVLFPTAVFADGCAAVTLRDCTLRAFHCVHGRSSQVAVEGSTLSGNTAFVLPHVSTAAGRGVLVEGGSVTMARSQVFGGNGLTAPTFSVDPGPAVELHGGELRLCEDPSGTFAAGQLAGSGPMPAVGGTAGTVVRDPGATLSGSNGGPAVAAPLTDVVRPLPSLRTVPAGPGGTVAADVTTPLGESVLLAVALPGPVTAVPGVDGSLWLDAATAVLVAVGVPQAGAPVLHAIAIPNTPVLVAARFCWQAVAWSATDGLRASNPSTHAL